MLLERVITYIKSVAPKSKVSFLDNSIYMTDVSKTTMDDIQYAINEFICTEELGTRFEVKTGVCDVNGDIQMLSGLSLLDKSGIALPAKVNKAVAPKLSENSDVIRYIIAAKMLWPKSRIYASRDVLITEFDIHLLFDVNTLPDISSEPVYRALCNIPEECSDENQVFTFLLRSDPVRSDLLDITDLVEVLYG